LDFAPMMALPRGEGDSLTGGERNPSSIQTQELTRETEIIAETDTYGTRQSNKSDNGGGAIYGCRSGAGGTASGNEPCLRGNNLSSGLAFEFNSGGAAGGLITVGAGGDDRKPTTNATGVATGLNADRVDDVEAGQLVRRGFFARVAADGTLQSSRGADSAGRSGEGTYAVSFGSDVSDCGVTAAQSSIDNAGATAVEVQAATPNVVLVRTRAGGRAAGRRRRRRRPHRPGRPAVQPHRELLS
jgi:hypothetical protein